MSIQTVLQLIKEHKVKFVDLRFTDTRGKEQHVSVPAKIATEEFLSEGKMFDGSSIAGWKSISQSDMVLMPDPSTVLLDPFAADTTLNIRCDIVDPSTHQNYTKDPRSVAKRAEQYLKTLGIGDECFFGPEPEFFILDDVRWKIDIKGAFYAVDSNEASWNSDTQLAAGNLGHRPTIKGGYFPVPPVDSSQDLRAAMCLTLESMGLEVEVHHHEVATGNQNEIGTKFRTLLRKADEMQNLKYVIQNVAYSFGKTATFMPKPLVGDNGNGMHCHISLSKAGENIFSGESYAGLSDTALHFIGGILKHAKALNALTNATTNSYKRLVPGFEAPVYLVYSAQNRSASIRIPYTTSPQGRRIEIRFPDPCSNPYLAFSGLLMAGLDGVRNQIHPGAPMDQDLYCLSQHEAAELPTVAGSLAEAITALDQDRAFLKEGGVFNDELIDGYIQLKQQEIIRLQSTTHPVEFDMYYSL